MINLIVAAAVAIFGFSMAAEAQTKWDMPLAYPVSNFHTVNAQAFADAVEKASGGKLKIVLHPNGALFKAPEIKRAVQTAQAPIGEVLMVNLNNEDAIFGADGVPFLATDYASAKKLADVQRPHVAKRLDAQGMALLYTVPWPPQGIYAPKEVNTLADLEGLKWRSYSPQTARIGELIKAQPVTIQAAELSQALATGKINSYMSSGSTGRDSKTYEHLKFFVDTQAWLPKNMVVVNKDALAKLDKATQDAVMAEAKKAEEAGWKASVKEMDDALGELAKNGMKISKPTAAFMTEFKTKIGNVMIAEWAKSAGPDAEAIAKAMQ